MHIRFHFVFLLPALFFFCKNTETGVTAHPVPEAYQTERDTTGNIDSPAAWHGPAGEHWLIATAKEGDALLVYDALDGAFLRRVGETGKGPGRFSRPNGVFVIDDIILVVERDNRRVQVLDLPNFRHIGFIGDSLLVRPYGLFVHKLDSVTYSLYVTDNYETKDEQIPPDHKLGHRVHQYEFSMDNGQFTRRLLKKFGDTTGDGKLRVVESIWGDADNNCLLIAEEDKSRTCVKVYNLQGDFSGVVFGRGLFKYQVEGIALYHTDADKKYWIVTDQSHTANRFHIFTSAYDYTATFTGPNTSNTDGIWLSQQPFGPFNKGIFFAVNDDGNVSAFDWQNVLETTGLAKP